MLKFIFETNSLSKIKSYQENSIIWYRKLFKFGMGGLMDVDFTLALLPTVLTNLKFSMVTPTSLIGGSCFEIVSSLILNIVLKLCNTKSI